MGKALYRKYRSKSLDEIIGQEHITTTLKNAIAAGNISHAYLFTGPRGVGKTSIARILAHEINQLPYADETTHLDIIEIDAASNRRIDEIRDLRERVHIAPTSSKFKVYIIDEVHMLTKEAFNALLKTLEEPPAHAVFILATTEAHKLPDTIVSRTQRFTFKPVSEEKVVNHLKSIAKNEGLSIDDDGMNLLASHGGGSFRDSISMLDQARGQGDAVALSDIERLLGIAPDDLIARLIDALSGGTPAEIITHLQTIRDQGYQAGQIAKQLSKVIRGNLVDGTNKIDAVTSVAVLNKLLTVPSAQDQMAKLELILIEAVMGNAPVTPREAPVVVPKEKPKAPTTPEPVKVADISPVEPEPQVEAPEKNPTPVEQTKEAKSPKKTSSKAAVSTSTFDDAAWNQALETLKQTHNTLYSVARMADATISGGELVLTFKFAFHQKRLNETKNMQVISDVIKKVTGNSIQVTCVVGVVSEKPKELSVEPPVAASTQSDPLAAISNIFGSAEVLES